MESVALTIPIFTFSKSAKSSRSSFPRSRHRHFSKLPANQTRLLSTAAVKCIHPGNCRQSKDWFLISFGGSLFQSSSKKSPISRRLASISTSSSAFGSGGGGDGIIGGKDGGDGGDGGSSGEETETKSLGGESDEVAASSPDVIILDVGGMSCGGCASSVQRILESQPQVSSASVNLATETAVVWVVPEVHITQNWQHQLGDKLAKHLTSCGFKSNLKGELIKP